MGKREHLVQTSTNASLLHPNMSIRTVFSDSATIPPVDDNLYNLSGAELDFFKSQTGIDDDEKLRRHILSAQKEAYKVCGESG